MMDLTSGIVVGSHNRKKLIELREVLEPLGWKLQSVAEFPNAVVVDETGTTFIENACLKASVQAVNLGRWTIGEDSGLCVPALGGQPGVYSARYSGENATDESNNQKLLASMTHLQGDDRRAYYVSTIALSDPQGQIVCRAEGHCWGRILTEYRGSGGFGYDPLFEIPEYHRTFSELGLAVKSAISHRGRALRSFVQSLPR